MAKLRVLDLFSGIGGFSLGLERTGGFETVAFCEIEDFPRRVLAKHWPDVPCYRDVRELTGQRLAADGIAVDVICGGFPCQDISDAGKRAGIAGERSGLWSEIARLARDIRPQFLIVENVSALLSRGLGTVLGDLAEIGFDAEWHCIPAAHVGAPHRRDRIWLVAYPNGGRLHWCYVDIRDGRQVPAQGLERFLCGSRRSEGGVADAASSRSLSSTQAGIHRSEEGRRSWHGQPQRCGWWAIEPDVGRVAHGVPSRVDRLKALGNAVVPQVVELIGNAILASLHREAA